MLAGEAGADEAAQDPRGREGAPGRNPGRQEG